MLKNKTSTPRQLRLFSEMLLLIAMTFVVGACRQDMHDQPRLEVYQEDANRAPVEGAVARDAMKYDAMQPIPVSASATGTQKLDDFPFAITAEVLERGQNRYNVYCAPCHSLLGDGNGMIVQRGFKRPPSYHEERLVNAPASYYYDVMTNGFGAMASYSDKLSPEDRWKVAAYIRALQLSQRAKIDDVPPADRAKLETVESGAQPAHGETH